MLYFSMASRRSGSLLAVGVILIVVVGGAWFSFSLRKYDKYHQNKKRYENSDFDQLVLERKQSDQDGVVHIEGDNKEFKKREDCQFGFGFLKKLLKPVDGHESSNQDIIQPSKGGLRQGSYCLDSVDGSDGDVVQIQECHGQGRNQEWKITVDNMIENVGQESMCLAAEKESLKKVILRQCNNTILDQKWNFNGRKGRFSPEQHTNLCLEIAKARLVVKPCVDKGKDTQMFDFVMTEVINLEDSIK